MFKRVFVLLVVLCFAANASAALVATYDMEEGSGTAIADGTGSNDGTFHGTYPPAWTTDSPTGSYALDFGQGDTEKRAEVELGTFDPRGTNGDLGFSMWIKWEGASAMWESKWWSRGQAIVKKMDSWGDNTGFMFMIRDWEQTEDPCGPAGNDMGGLNGHLAFLRNGSRAYWNDGQDEIDLLVKGGVWSFIEVYLDNSADTVYLRTDGGAWYDKPFVYAGSGGEALQLGQNTESGDDLYSFNGAIDGVSFYDGIPEPATIALLGLGGLLLRRRRK